MKGRTAKVIVYMLVMIFVVSTIMPVVLSEDFEQNMHEASSLIPGKTASDGRFAPLLKPEEPKVTVVVETEDGKQLTMEVSEGLEGEELEETIEERIEEEPVIDEEEMVEEPRPEEEETSEPEGTMFVELHSSVNWNYLQGYFFCMRGQDVCLDAEDLYNSYSVIRYEWDFNGNGIYDLVSSTPSIYHSFDEVGLYTLRVKITYSFNYTYYLYPRNQDDSGLVFFGDYETEEPTLTAVTKIDSLEYETRVSVGSEEEGYPPILDFEYKIVGEPESTEVDELDIQEQKTPTTSGQPGLLLAVPTPPVIELPAINDDVIIYFDIYPDKDIHYTPKTHVRMFQVRDEILIPHVPDCAVEFNASKTVTFEGDSEFHWDFGDGTEGTGEVVSHTYKRKGTYTATLWSKGWEHSHKATFVILRGKSDPRIAFLTNTYSYSDFKDEYLFCRLGETMNFDMSSLVSFDQLAWIEWDFDCDGVFEENTTTPGIHKTFKEAGYFEVRLRYTYRYEPYCWYPIKIWGDYPATGNDDSEPVYYYSTTEYTIKVAVANENNIYPPIPDFYVTTSPSFSWWVTTIDFQGGHDEIRLKNTTYLCAFSESDLRLNSWNGSVALNANTTFDLNNPRFDSFTYDWDFGDGTTGMGIETTHVYEDSKIDYEVRLTVSNGLFVSNTIRLIRPRPYSPNIYLYREEPGYDSVKVIVDGAVTKAVPQVELGSEITWENVWIEDGKLFYDGKSYDFLYYEELIEPQPSRYGWILERDESGTLFLNDEKMTLEELMEFFRDELGKTGLYHHEIEDFVKEWLGEGGRLFPGETVFRYAIMHVPETIIDEIIQIETQLEYDEIIRVHFLVQPAGEDLVLEPPRYPEHKKGINVLHEWGVFTDSTVAGENGNQEEVSHGLSNDVLFDLPPDTREIYNLPRIYHPYVDDVQAERLLFDTPKKTQFD